MALARGCIVRRRRGCLGSLAHEGGLWVGGGFPRVVPWATLLRLPSQASLWAGQRLTRGTTSNSHHDA
jgi:hypothetical protein